MLHWFSVVCTDSYERDQPSVIFNEPYFLGNKLDIRFFFKIVDAWVLIEDQLDFIFEVWVDSYIIAFLIFEVVKEVRLFAVSYRPEDGSTDMAVGTLITLQSYAVCEIVFLPENVEHTWVEHLELMNLIIDEFVFKFSIFVIVRHVEVGLRSDNIGHSFADGELAEALLVVHLAVVHQRDQVPVNLRFEGWLLNIKNFHVVLDLVDLYENHFVILLAPVTNHQEEFRRKIVKHALCYELLLRSHFEIRETRHPLFVECFTNIAEFYRPDLFDNHSQRLRVLINDIEVWYSLMKDLLLIQTAVFLREVFDQKIGWASFKINELLDIKF